MDFRSRAEALAAFLRQFAHDLHIFAAFLACLAVGIANLAAAGGSTAPLQLPAAKAPVRAPVAQLPEYEPQPAPQAVGTLAGVVGGRPAAVPVVAGTRPLLVHASSVPAVKDVRVDRAHRIAQLRHVVAALTSRIHAHQGKAPKLVKALKRRKGLLARMERRAADGPPLRALAWARAQIGTTESPANSNRGPSIDQWQRDHGMLGQPWCGAFAGEVLRHGGVTLPNGIVYTPTILQWGRTHAYGLRIVTRPEPGDLVLYDFFAGGPPVMHVGVYEGNGATIEGNTSSGNAGSQDNGGGVFRRYRGGQFVVAYVRPPWPRA